MIHSPADIVAAHQYLYYVKGRPIWTDYQYDAYCQLHGIEGNGGSDLESSYDELTKCLAGLMLLRPDHWPAPTGVVLSSSSGVSD